MTSWLLEGARGLAFVLEVNILVVGFAAVGLLAAAVVVLPFALGAAAWDRTTKLIRGRTSSTSTCSIATAIASIAEIRRTFSRRSTITRFRRARRALFISDFPCPKISARR